MAARNHIFLIFLILTPLVSFADSAFEGTQGSVTRSGLNVYGGQIDGLAVAPNGNLYAGLNSPNGVFCSTDGGENWSGPPAGSDFGVAGKVQVGGDSSTVFFMTSAGLLRTTNACESFTALEGTQQGMDAFSDSFVYAHGRLLVANGNGTVDVSSDEGDNFVNRVIDGSVEEIVSLAAGPNADTFFAAIRNNTDNYFLYRSTNGGDSWNGFSITAFPAIENFAEVAVNPDDPSDIIIVVQRDGLAMRAERHTGGGAWDTTFTDALPGIAETAVGFDNVRGRVYIGQYFTADNGTTWEDINNDASSVGTSIRGTFTPGHENNILYMASGMGIAKSVDGGDNWSDMVNGMIGIIVFDIMQSASNPDIACFSSNAGVGCTSNYSDKENMAWMYPLVIQSGGADIQDVTALHINPDNPDILVATASDSVWRSTNAGQSWVNVQNQGFIENLEGSQFVSLENGDLIAGFRERGADSGAVGRSTDGGLNWQDLEVPGDVAVNALAAIGETVFAGVGNNFETDPARRGIRRYSGGVWADITVGTPLHEHEITGITVGAENALFAVSASIPGNPFDTPGSVFRSMDMGDTWEDLGESEGLAEGNWFRAVASDPASPSTIYAAHGRPGGKAIIFVSRDNGDSWSTHFEGLTDEVPERMFVNDLTAGFNTGVFLFAEEDEDLNVVLRRRYVNSGRSALFIATLRDGEERVRMRARSTLLYRAPGERRFSGVKNKRVSRRGRARYILPRKQGRYRVVMRRALDGERIVVRSNTVRVRE